MAFTNHPLRDRIVSEMHMRRMPALSAPALMVQVIRLVDPADRDAEHAHVAKMPDVPKREAVVSARHINGQTPKGIDYLWERHSEATTATTILPREGGDPFAAQSGDLAAMAWLSDAPGGVLRAVKVGIVRDEADALAIAPGIGFSDRDLVSCRIGDARIWSDFLLHADGFGRLLVAAGNTLPADLGRLVQQVQELGNYRNLALLGLPLAQAEAPLVGALESELVTIAERMAKGEGNAALLDELCQLSAQVTEITATTAFRMSATAAYASIAQDRLAAVASSRIQGYQTLEEFTDRRLLPAVRTCASFVDRLEALSIRIERATSLLRTRVEMTVQAQNVELLRSMDRSSARQFRLQKVVEGLSVVAVSYYAVGLLAYLFKGVAKDLHASQEQLAALAVVPVFFLVWLYMRWRVRRIEPESKV